MVEKPRVVSSKEKEGRGNLSGWLDAVSRSGIIMDALLSGENHHLLLYIDNHNKKIRTN